jgi:hypothetical protein
MMLVIFSIWIYFGLTHTAQAQSIIRHPYIQNVIKNVIPNYYPALVEYTKGKGSFDVQYTTESKEIQKILVSYGRNALSISAVMHTVSPGFQGSKSVSALLTDSDLDGHPDIAVYSGDVVPGGTYTQAKPQDDTTLFTWYSGIFAVVRFSDCCGYPSRKVR